MQWLYTYVNIANKWNNIKEHKEAISDPFYVNIQRHLFRKHVPIPDNLKSPEECASRFYFVTVHQANIEINFKRLVNTVIFYGGSCLQKEMHSHFIFGFSYPKHPSAILLSMMNLNPTSRPNIEAVYTSFPQCQRYIHDQFYAGDQEFSSNKCYIARGWDNQTNYKSFNNQREGLTRGHDLQKISQFGLGYNDGIPQNVVAADNIPVQRWHPDNFCAIFLNELEDILMVNKIIIARYFANIMDTYIIKDQDLRYPTDYNEQPIIMILNRSFSHTLQFNPPFIISYTNTQLSNQYKLNPNYNTFYSIQHFELKPMNSFKLYSTSITL
jgi:hypothetical protein